MAYLCTIRAQINLNSLGIAIICYTLFYCRINWYAIMLKQIKAMFSPAVYISRLDQFLTYFDRNSKLSDAQRREIEKYNRISQLRDNKAPETRENTFWDQF